MDQWKEYQYGDIVTIKSSRINPEKHSGIKCIELEHISQGSGEILGWIEVSEQKSTKNVFESGQVLFGKLRPYLRKFAQPNFDGVCSSEIWVMNSKCNVLMNDYLYFIVQSNQFIDLANNSTGSKMPRADWSYIQEKTTKIPSLFEQTKIVEILSTWDEALTTVDQLIRYAEEEYIALANRLLTQKNRFSLFKKDWSDVKFGEIVKEVSEKTVEHNQHPVLTSSRKGIFLQEEYFQKSVSSKDNTGYKIIKKGQFTFRAMSDDGAFKFNRLEEHEIGIVSPAYSVFKAINIEPRFLNIYMNSHIFTREIGKASQGGTRLSLKFNALAQFTLRIPNNEEQIMISDACEVFQKKRELLLSYREQLFIQKQGLLAQLLTGRLRVAVS
ncbi:MAG: hypothetical protein CVV57_10430 [Tenericutes bacterium HGW-Tenericutes-2]|jgi:type I restriction enzyme S subunit|nr:MAG: hypothetical protein CVV57_10430 [Tenericutes bacterium HGW-Tenericutes-2]